MKYIRRGEEGVRASDLGPSENQASSLVEIGRKEPRSEARGGGSRGILLSPDFSRLAS